MSGFASPLKDKYSRECKKAPRSACRPGRADDSITRVTSGEAPGRLLMEFPTATVAPPGPFCEAAGEERQGAPVAAGAAGGIRSKIAATPKLGVRDVGRGTGALGFQKQRLPPKRLLDAGFAVASTESTYAAQPSDTQPVRSTNTFLMCI